MCLYLPKLLRRTYHLMINGLLRIFGYNQRKNNSKRKRRLISINESFVEQLDQSRSGKIDNFELLQMHVEELFRNKIKQDKKIEEMENLILSINEICHSLVIEYYKQINGINNDKAKESKPRKS